MQNELTTQQQDAIKRKVVDFELDNDKHERLCVQHQGKLRSMTQRDLKHMTINDGDTHMVHGGKDHEFRESGQIETQFFFLAILSQGF